MCDLRACITTLRLLAWQSVCRSFAIHAASIAPYAHAVREKHRVSKQRACGRKDVGKYTGALKEGVHSSAQQAPAGDATQHLPLLPP